MTTPEVSLPALRAFLGSIACTATTSTSTNRGLRSLEGALTKSDADVQSVVNALVAAIDALAGNQSITVIDSGTPTVANAAQTDARLVRLVGTITPVLRTVRLASRAAGTEWVVRNECATAVEIGGPSGTCVTIAGGNAVQHVIWDGTNMLKVGQTYAVADTPGTPGLIDIPDDTTVFLRGDGAWTGVGAQYVAVQTGTAPAAFTAKPWQTQVSRTGGAVAVTFTLPASPNIGDIFEAINVDIPNHTLTLARNGKKINGGTSDLVMATSLGHQRLIYIDATTGWWSAGKQ